MFVGYAKLLRLELFTLPLRLLFRVEVRERGLTILVTPEGCVDISTKLLAPLTLLLTEILLFSARLGKRRLFRFVEKDRETLLSRAVSHQPANETIVNYNAH